MKHFIHTQDEVASKRDTNSTHIVEIAVMACFALLRDITPPADTKMYPDVDFVNQHIHQIIGLSIHQHVVFGPLKVP